MNKIVGSSIMLSKFRGCILGGLLGDCCGAPYEGEKLGTSEKSQLQKSLNQLEKKEINENIVKPYTDDTAMTVALMKCLIENKSLPSRKIARSYCKSYFENKNRGFGGAVPKVLYALRQNKFEDVHGPAEQQFNGSGSFGNGAAMRVSPIGLFTFNKSAGDLVKLVIESSIITHTNHLAINGAILQALAVNYCVKEQPDKFDKHAFLDFLHEQMKNVEHDEIDMEMNDPKQEYQKQIVKIKELINKKPSDEMVINYLGNSVAALYSVPTAIYCFLRALEPIEGIKTENILRRAVEYSIHLGGDTDTIASMAGSIAGALFGEENVPRNLIGYCEAYDDIVDLADRLYEASSDC